MKKHYHNLSNNSQGILFAILCCFFASILISLVRHLSANYHVFFIVLVRNFFGLMFFVPHIIKDRKDMFKTGHLSLHLFRGVNGLASMLIWFYVVTKLPLSEAVSISFIIPILTTAAAAIFLKEKVSNKSWLALIIGFAGILIIMRPGFKAFNPIYLFSFASVILWTLSNVAIKSLSRTEKPKTIVAYMSLVMMICSIPFALPYLKPIALVDLFYFVFLGLVSNLTHICLSISYSKTDLSVVQPFDFMRLIFTAIIAYFAFGEIIDFWVVIGSLVILFGVVLSLPRKKAKNQIVFDVD